MPLDAVLDLALAVRMGAASALPSGVALPCYRTATECTAAEALILPAGTAATAVADAVAARTRAAGAPPATVRIDGAAAFVLDPPPAVPPAGCEHRLAGVVTIVTGAAQGIGRGIAEELAGQGARVVVADVNPATAGATADALNRAAGPGAAMAVTVDVTRLASVEAAVAATVRRYGGLDLVVANAGVLKAGGLAELDESAFDLVNAVNYKGFFLTAKGAIEVLRRQHALHPEHGMDVIQINSKSGLEGSNRNFAYAGSKFGGIGLVQSFALELVSDGIKVNAICPGNYFDGPLWSDPNNGLFVQYLRAGKVPGAKTIDDVRAFYTAKVPMRRGVTPADIGRAIVYLREQRYETGQALPVTGGQIMLH